jgi:CMP-2-keto-3-deoxyoctulosonic acid synthetase
MVVIPARYGSSRFPGKPLVMLGRKPMIQHVYEHAAACRLAQEVMVATDDERIKQAVERFGGRVAMVAGDYRTGTDRVAGVARMFDRRLSSESILSLSASAGFGLARRHLSIASFPSPFTFSKATV